MPNDSLEGANVVVVGAARSGIAAAELLARRGARVTLSDQRPQVDAAKHLPALGITLDLGTNEPVAASAADLLVMSPGVPLELPVVVAAKSRGVPVVGELELAFRWLRGRVIAITGTKGKSTTTTLIGRMLEAGGHRVRVGGNIGVPLSAQVDESTADTLHVVEASSFQLESTDTFKPWIAALLNFSPDHLDRHPTETAYGEAKARIFVNQSSDDWAVVNGDSDTALALAARARARRVRYAIDRTDTADIFASRGFIWQRTSEGETPLVPLSAIALPGRHMLSNVAAAAAVCCAAGVSGEPMTAALAGFTGIAHVMEPAGVIDGVTFVNDSKATNVDAARRSIESFDKVVVILGGKYKGGDFADLRPALAARGRAIVTIGEARPLIARALGDVQPLVEAGTLDEAVRAAWTAAQPDGVVLLAPACSSFDMFADYADRGRQFKRAVERLVSERRTKK